MTTIFTPDNGEGYAFALFICLSAQLRKNYSADSHKIRKKVGTLATEDTVRFRSLEDLNLARTEGTRPWRSLHSVFRKSLVEMQLGRSRIKARHSNVKQLVQCTV